jgi:excisionase family DNA binding protein
MARRYWWGNTQPLPHAMSALKRAALLSAQKREIALASEQPLVTKKVVAADLGVGTRTIEKWVAERRIPFIRMGHRSLRFRLDDVRKAISRWTTREIS